MEVAKGKGWVDKIKQIQKSYPSKASFLHK
jgi:hypothetical protein